MAATKKTTGEQGDLQQQDKRGRTKSLVGQVVANKMEKTVVVAITKQIQHPVYKKYIRRTKKYFAHDEQNACALGDRVRIFETRPMSKNKRWRVQEILEKAPVL